MTLKLHKLTTQELEEWRMLLNLTDDELIVFKRKSILEISEVLRVSTRTVDNRIRDIRTKINRLNRSFLI